MNTIRFGIIGYPLGHSFSPDYFTKKFLQAGRNDMVYEKFPIKNITEIPELINSHPDLRGLSVTIPYKEAILNYLHEIHPEAASVGAVNTLLIRKKGNESWLTGYNTDIFGFEQSLLPILGHQHNRALILGTGGASKAVQFVMNKLNIPYQLVSRNSSPGLNYRDVTAEVVQSHTLIVNTTPLGMFPETDGFPDIPYQAIGQNHLLFDLIYNPEMSQFLQKGKYQGAEIMNGLKMLHLQADKAFEIWCS